VVFVILLHLIVSTGIEMTSDIVAAAYTVSNKCSVVIGLFSGTHVKVLSSEAGS